MEAPGADATEARKALTSVCDSSPTKPNTRTATVDVICTVEPTGALVLNNSSTVRAQRVAAAIATDALPNVMPPAETSCSCTVASVRLGFCNATATKPGTGAAGSASEAEV